MKKLFSIFFFLLSTISFAHQIDSVKTLKWKIGFVLSPNYTYRIVNTVSPLPSWLKNDDEHYTTDDQVSKYGFHIGVIFAYQIANWCTLQTGLLLDKKGYNTNTLYFYPHFGSRVPYHNSYNYTYIGVPMFINIGIPLNKKLSISACLGASASPIERSKIISSINQNINTDLSFSHNKDELTIMIIGKLGMIYKINNNKIITIFPVCSYDTNSDQSGDSDDSKYKRIHLYSLGIEVGMNFTINKKNKK